MLLSGAVALLIQAALCRIYLAETSPVRDFSPGMQRLLKIMMWTAAFLGLVDLLAAAGI